MRVLYFGVLKDIVGHRSVEMDVADGLSVEGLLQRHREMVAAPEMLWGALAVAVNQHYAKATDELHPGDEVALLPPVSGGCAA